jgi:ABC-type sugar transport system ATPase subunit
MINIENLNYRYDKRKTDGVSNLSFCVGEGEIVTLIGPSGSGKTTTLKCLAGLLTPMDDGHKSIHFQKDASISYVNQTPDLNPELSVFENLKLALPHIEDSQKKENQIRTVLAQLEITNEIESLVKNISGGQQQRVIMARSLVSNPTVLLLDEPFANLDKTLRLQLFEDLIPLFKERKITVLWVTHNTEEALRFSDQLVLLNHGQLIQKGSPKELYFEPKNMFSATFFGETNIIACKIKADDASSLEIELFGEDFSIPRPSGFKIQEYKDCLVVLKAECLIPQEDGPVCARICKNHFLGATSLLELEISDKTIWCKVPSSNSFQIDAIINLNLITDSIHCLSEV